MAIVETVTKIYDQDRDLILEIQEDNEHSDFLNITEVGHETLVIHKDTAVALADVLYKFKLNRIALEKKDPPKLYEQGFMNYRP